MRVGALLPARPWGTRARLAAGLQAAFAAPEGVDRERLEDGLLSLVLGAFGPLSDAAGAGGGKDGLSRARRLAVVDGLVAIADRAEEQPSLAAVCAELGAPLRTLNAASNALLGVSAAAYLRARRLNRAFRDLSRGAAASVTEAATANGFWELGRFAGEYRALFGESPSATLRRARGRARQER